MNAALVDRVVQAVLYEGYILYPYQASSKKNARSRFTFGRLYPEAFSIAQRGLEPSSMQTECLLEAKAGDAVEVTVRFLQPVWREIGELPSPLAELPHSETPEYRLLPELSIGGRAYQTWQEAAEREARFVVRLPQGEQSNAKLPLAIAASRQIEPILDENNRVAGIILRRHEALSGLIEATACRTSEGCFKITVRITNQTSVTQNAIDDQDAIVMRSLTSTHTILHSEGGAFVSLIDPPPRLKALADTCKNIGAWPVLVGDKQSDERDTILASPIILYDYPQIAPESGGEFFDGTEIDEMLALRVLTLSDAEKQAMASVDARAREILNRTEGMSAEKLFKLHGTLRDVKPSEDFFNPTTAITSAWSNGREIRAGDKVLLRPKARADAIDLLMAGKTAIIEALERDMEDKVHVAVVLEDDPGRDLGMQRQPGHRFFYALDEIEPLNENVA